MNKTLSCLMKRRSIRKYADRPIEEDAKKAVLDAAFRAPTAGAMMLYSIIEVEDPQKKAQLAESCDHQPFIATAPWLLLFLADYQRWQDGYAHFNVEEAARQHGRQIRQPGVGDLMLACLDAIIAAQTAVIAAESLGIGSCYIGDILENYEIHQKLLNLPRYTMPIALVCFGYPAASEMQRKYTPRFDRDLVLFKDSYRRLTKEELERAFNADPEAVNAAERNYLRKFSADFSFEMTRSVKKMLENWQQDFSPA
ncbi:MAG: nitroreductase [Chloroflexi bacterium]|nr:nitroreductase [Chloroflexota bacterium]